MFNMFSDKVYSVSMYFVIFKKVSFVYIAAVEIYSVIMQLFYEIS